MSDTKGMTREQAVALARKHSLTWPCMADAVMEAYAMGASDERERRNKEDATAKRSADRWTPITSIHEDHENG